MAEQASSMQDGMGSYDDILDWYVSVRSPIAGVKDVQAFLQHLPAGGTILELGCGTGMPISQLIVQKGFKLFAIDGSQKMINCFKKNFPGVEAVCAQLEEADYFNGVAFDAVLSWGVLFHLPAEQQEAVINKTAACLKAGGRFFFTSQKDILTGLSTMNGVNFPYISLGNERYAAVLKRAGMRLVDEHFDRWGNYVYIAEKY